MPETTLLDTDLLTPLGAYLRLRAAGGASFLLESVDQGRLGRYSLVGSGSRLVGIDEAERSGEAVVGHRRLRLDRRSSSRRCRCRTPATGLPVSRFVVADVLLRFDHVRGVSEVLRGDPEAIAALLEAPAESPPAASGFETRPVRRFPDQATHEERVLRCKEHIRAGDAFQIVLSQRAERPTVGDAARDLPRRSGASTRRRTCSCSSSATTR